MCTLSSSFSAYLFRSSDLGCSPVVHRKMAATHHDKFLRRLFKRHSWFDNGYQDLETRMQRHCSVMQLSMSQRITQYQRYLYRTECRLPIPLLNVAMSAASDLSDNERASFSAVSPAWNASGGSLDLLAVCSKGILASFLARLIHSRPRTCLNCSSDIMSRPNLPT